MRRARGLVARCLPKRVIRLIRPARWGNLRRLEPFNRSWGFDRGTPVDRVFIDDFCRRHAADVRGRAAEIKDPSYIRRFGGSAVVREDVVDIDAANPEATIVADLAEPGSLPAGRFDCFLLLQTLQLVGDARLALANCWESLAPGGVLLVTVPSMSKLDTESTGRDRWRFTPDGLAELLRAACPGAELDVAGYGNVCTAVAFLLGLSAEELTERELGVHDPDFPVLSAGRARKRAV